VAGTMTCLDKNSGSMVWKKELWDELGGTFLNHGYSSSPFAYKDTVIALVGGEGHSVVAFNKSDGAVKWQKQDFGNSYCTPKLISIDGQDQLICFMGREIIGLDPDNGELKWSIAHENQWQQNCTLPIWTEDNVLVFTSQGPGTKAVRLSREGDETKVEELWSTRKMRLHHSNAVQVGDHVYCISGDNVNFFMAVNVKTGELAWRERGYAKSNLIYGDGKFIVLDEDGNLMLVTATPEAATVVAKVPLLEKVSWTVPTLVGKTLYVRDQKNIVALDLG
jgi:outer membrane protein assembly factor BamB